MWRSILVIYISMTGVLQDIEEWPMLLDKQNELASGTAYPIDWVNQW